MRVITLFLFTGLFSISLSLKAQPKHEKEKELLKFPRYEKMARQFFGGYTYPAESAKQLQFARKPDGWYTYEVDPFNPTLTHNEQLFWSLKGGYQKLNYPTSINGTYIPKAHLNFLILYGFERIPYFGYKGWAYDVVNNFSLAEALSDTTLEGLARAHMNIATEVNDPRALSANPTYLNMPEEQKLKVYNLHAEAEIEAYLKLQKINPNYETFVGEVALKIGNEIMDHYFQMEYYGKEKFVADKYFKKEIYPKFYIDMAKNFLMGCAKNAVLFCNGDSDTYPLWYVQVALGFRTDVQVINISLLNGTRYFEKVLSDAKAFPFKTTLSESKFANGKREFAYCKEQSDSNYFSAKEVLDYLATDDTTKQILAADNAYHSTTPGKNIKLPIDLFKIKAIYELSNDPSYTLGKQFKWELNNSYILKSDIILLDLITNNISDRPFYFTISTGPESMLGLDDHILSRGMSLAILPVLHEDHNFRRNFDLNTAYDLLMNKYLFTDLHESVSDGYHRFIRLYRAQFSSLAEQLIDAGKKKEALALLDRSAALFPVSNTWLDISLNYDVFQYYRLGETKKAIVLTEKLIAICAAVLKKEGVFATNNDDDYQEAKRFLGILQELAKNNKQEELAKKIGGVLGK